MKQSSKTNTTLIAMLVLLASPCHLWAQGISFNHDIRPLLSSRCFACHGPDAEGRKAGLRLDQPDGDEGAVGYAIEPGSVDDSEMWNRITSDDESDMMPPPESHLKPFNEEELDRIRRWIEAGAEYEGFWAFQPPIPPSLPDVKSTSWSKRSIDLHVLKKLELAQRSPSVEADPRTLIRRVTFDLTGLPPTRAEIAQFLKSHSRSPSQAWEQLVDSLLAKPQYGEHIGRYWLDLVRFADSNGMHKDFHRNHTAYRDWVIRSFNDNLPYDDFLRDQLAGDLHPQPTKDQLIASGFNRLHLIIDRGTALPEESFSKNVIDRVTAVSTAFLGLTVQCAQCHDHKYDPITQKDFYSLAAFFNNIDAKPETVSKSGPVMGFQRPYISLGTAQQENRMVSFDQNIAKLRRKLKAAAAKAKELESENESLTGKDPADQPSTVVSPGQSLVTQLTDQLKALQKKRDRLDRLIPKAMVMKERAEVRPTFVLERGQYDAPGEEVSRNTPGFLPPMKTAGEVPTRMDLAEWFVDPKNPLTARVAVNRIWQQCFGVGLVKTSEDFGNQGDVPSHPQLLEHLAVSFVDSGWDMKALIKQIVMSKTYRQSSVATPEQFKADAENRLLARGSRYRLDAEMIRDQILATSGMLSKKMYGPSVKPPQPEGLWKAVSMIGEHYEADAGEAIRRRSVYTFWKRSMPPPQMTILNAPLRDACVARRERTNTPTQALLLLNEAEYFKAAGQLAAIVLQQPADQRLDYVWETVTARLPDEKEKNESQNLLADLKEKYSADPSLANQICESLTLAGEQPPAKDEPSPDAEDELSTDAEDELSPDARAELAAWTVLTSVLYNLDITKTKD
jgi:hypothetical protein